jgi:glycoprotein endo-alpha-1,2-mannosidase
MKKAILIYLYYSWRLMLIIAVGRNVSSVTMAVSTERGEYNANAEKRPQIAVYYYPWWNNPSNPHWTEGYLRELLQPQPQQPLLGEYFSQDQGTVDQHLEWMTQYGITQLIASWFGPNRFGDSVIQNQVFGSGKLGNLIKVGILYESRGRLERNATDNGRIYFDNTVNNNEQQLLDDFTFLATNYFGRPNYLKVDGKPVVYIYLTRSFRGDFAGAIARLRSHVSINYGYSLYLVGDELYWRTPDPARIGLYDAITTYNMHGPGRYEGYPDSTGFLTDVEATYQQWREIANSLGVALIPNAMPAYNDRGTRLVRDNYAIPHERNAGLAGSRQYSTFQESLRIAYRLLQSQSIIGVSEFTITITTWNEWNEDTNIEPTKGDAGSSSNPVNYTKGFTYDDYGFGLLQVIQDFLQPFNPPTQPPSIAPTQPPSMSPTPFPTNEGASCSLFDGFSTFVLNLFGHHSDENHDETPGKR